MHELIKKQIAADYFQQRFSNDGQRFVDKATSIL
jgi:hypothetical protein